MTTTNNNDKNFGLQYPTKASRNNIKSNNSSSSSSSNALGPTAYIVGKRKRYVEEDPRRFRTRSLDRFENEEIEGNERTHRERPDVWNHGFDERHVQ